MQIKQKVAVVSGGASGLGWATAQRLQALGAYVAILDINEEELARCAKSDGISTYQCDVTDALSVEQALESVMAEYSLIDINVNCAGIAPAARIVGRDGAMPLAEFERVIQVNLVGTFNVMRLVAACMQERDPVADDANRGVIINTASVAAYEGQLGQAAYSASKGGVVAMTLPAAREFARWGVRVMTIAPGVMDTPMMAAMPEKVQASLRETIPFPSRFGESIEYARLVEQIIVNDYLNGSVVRLDGAIRMGSS
jgi:NAD(P)-dependent dehydrogenase (short-subunit alcohol dehydrogenase family)